MRKAVAGFALSMAAGLTVLGLVSGFVPRMDGPRLRPYTEQVLRQGESSAVTRPLDHVVWNVRGPFSREATPGEGALSTRPRTQERPPLIELQDGVVRLRTMDGPSIALADAGGVSLEPLFDSGEDEAQRKAADDEALVALELMLGEPLDFQGLPLRWSRDQKPLCGLSEDVQARMDKLLSGWRQLSGVSDNLRDRVARYRPTVEKYAQRYGLEPELVYAIIYTESSFNPTLVSSRSAHGLMQVVPETAGGEVHAWLGGRGIPDASLLLQPETNIRYGTSYFHLLMTRHLPGIRDRQSREYCAIASYNRGASGVLKSFGPTEEEALATINSMTPDEVRDHLLEKVRSSETRRFVRKVLESRDRFMVMR